MDYPFIDPPLDDDTFDPLETCENCGCLGAYYRGGDSLCKDCIEKERKQDSDYDNDGFLPLEDGDVDVWEEV